MTKEKQASNCFLDVLLRHNIGINENSKPKKKEILSKKTFVPGVVFTDGQDVLTLNFDGESHYYIEDLKSNVCLSVMSFGDDKADIRIRVAGNYLYGLLTYAGYEVISIPNT